MKLVLHGLILAFLLALLGERSYAAYCWKQEADRAIRQASQQAADADRWLHEPILTVQGRPLSRADLLDLVLAKALRPAAPATPERSVR